MARVSYARGSDNKIKSTAYKDGRIGISKDKHKIYLDADFQRKELNPGILIDNIPLKNWIDSGDEVYCEVDLSTQLINDKINFYDPDTILMVYGLTPEYYHNNIYCSQVIGNNKLKFVRDMLQKDNTILWKSLYCYALEGKNNFNVGDIIVVDFPEDVGYIAGLQYNKTWFSSVDINYEKRIFTFTCQVDTDANINRSQFVIEYNPRLYFDETCQILIQLPAYNTRITEPEIEVIPEGIQPEEWIPTQENVYKVGIINDDITTDSNIFVSSNYNGVYDTEVDVDNKTVMVYSNTVPDVGVVLNSNIINGKKSEIVLKSENWEDNTIIIKAPNEINQISQEDYYSFRLINDDYNWRGTTGYINFGYDYLYFEEKYKFICDFFEIEFELLKENYNSEIYGYEFFTEDGKGKLTLQGFIGNIKETDLVTVDLSSSINFEFFGGVMFKVEYNGTSEDLISGQPPSSIEWVNGEYAYNGVFKFEFSGINTINSEIIFNYESSQDYNINGSLDHFGNYKFTCMDIPKEDIIVSAIDISEGYDKYLIHLHPEIWEYNTEKNMYISQPCYLDSSKKATFNEKYMPIITGQSTYTIEEELYKYITDIQICEDNKSFICFATNKIEEDITIQIYNYKK